MRVAMQQSKKIAFDIIEEVGLTDTAQAEVGPDPISCSAPLKRKCVEQQARGQVSKIDPKGPPVPLHPAPSAAPFICRARGIKQISCYKPDLPL